MLILAGDIGGTKTNLALFDEQGNCSDQIRFASQHYQELQVLLQEYLQKVGKKVDFATLAIAGPVKKGVGVATNLAWVVNAAALSAALNIPHLFLINDLEANAYALDILPKENLLEIHLGEGDFEANRCVVSPGTGLGEAPLFWDGERYHPFACEGGHCEFGPRNELQIAFCRYIYKRFGHTSYERALSGPGLLNIYQFFRDEIQLVEPSWLTEVFQKEDPAKVISENALNERSEICQEALNLFVSILGAECSNCILKFMALGGIYLGGGIPPKILPALKSPHFFEGFADKGRFRELVEAVPIRVILDDQASLKGAARYCYLQLKRIYPQL